jgi:hypothetical protein
MKVASGMLMAMLVAVAVSVGGCEGADPSDISETTSKLVDPNTAHYDYSTACTVGGTTMHCCAVGEAMVGIRADQNVFKCASLQSGLSGGTRSLDTTTVRNSMHACPFGQVMVGFHQDLDHLACQTIPGNPISGEKVDTSTNDGYMHVCDDTYSWRVSAMSGIHIAQNKLTCATDPFIP